jgi:hypothetical protein
VGIKSSSTKKLKNKFLNSGQMDNLPGELIFSIFDYLKNSDIKNFCKASKIFDSTYEEYKKHQQMLFLFNEKNKKFNQKIITAPTQVGKTGAIIEMASVLTGIVLVIGQNRRDQQLQTMRRFSEKGLQIHKITYNTEPEELQRLLDRDGKIILSVMYNHQKIKFLDKIINKLSGFPEYHIFKDEADSLTGELASFYWVKHINKFISSSDENLKIRIYHVSATYKKCLEFTKDVFTLAVPDDYRPVNEFHEWDSTVVGGLELLIKKEVLSLKKGEMMLYSVNSVLRQHERAIFLSKAIKDIICITYNSKKITVYDGNTTKVFSKDIHKLLEVLKKQTKHVLIIGGSLINRGMSFCSKGEDGLAATVIFVSGCLNSNDATVVQKIGRITGTARPDLSSRRVYAHPSVLRIYTNYVSKVED